MRVRTKHQIPMRRDVGYYRRVAAREAIEPVHENHRLHLSIDRHGILHALGVDACKPPVSPERLDVFIDKRTLAERVLFVCALECAVLWPFNFVPFIREYVFVDVALTRIVGEDEPIFED